jgi:chromate transporter
MMAPAMRPGSALEVLRVFLRLGLTSFGGPIAHLGYFREELVVRRRWLEESAFADLVALCQFLPGPASSQVGFALGLKRAGWRGALAAWAGFTLPSALAMLLVAKGAVAFGGLHGQALAHGLKLVAVAVVAQAVWGMARSLCPDRPRAAIGVAALVLVLAGYSSGHQLAAILAGGLLGLAFCRDPAGAPATTPAPAVAHRGAWLALAAFALLLAVSLLPASALAASPPLALFAAFYRSGALVFGGGHVVLPLLRDAVVVPGWVGDDAFLAGYGAAQAVPGPLFTFAAYLGALASPAPGVGGAAIGLAGIFLPGLLVLVAALPAWERLRHLGWAQAALRGVNAAVVGLLAAVLYDPVFTTAVHTHADLAVAAACFVALSAWRIPPVLVVVAGAAASVMLGGG